MATFYTIISVIIFIYLTINIIYFLFFSVAGRLIKISAPPLSEEYKNIIILIPAYKEDIVIVNTAQEALKQKYPADKYKLMVVADSLHPEVLIALRKIPVMVHEVNFIKSTKIKSVNAAMKIIFDYDAVVILDADNIMHPDFLAKINSELQTGAKAIQGHRIALNEDTNMAFLDAVSEEINNHIFRKGHYVTGLSSALIGSAMAFDFAFFKKIIKDIDSVGEDKELELAILKQKEKIVYAESAIVYDEKVQNLEVFGNQRKRWLSSQITIFRKYFFSSFKSGNFDYFNKAMHSALLPRLLLLGFTIVMVIFSFILPIAPNYYFWTGLLLIYIFTILIAIPLRLYDKRFFIAILYVPKVFFIMVLLLFKLKGASKNFSNTPHTIISKTD